MASLQNTVEGVAIFGFSISSFLMDVLLLVSSSRSVVFLVLRYMDGHLEILFPSKLPKRILVIPWSGIRVLAAICSFEEADEEC